MLNTKSNSIATKEIQVDAHLISKLVFVYENRCYDNAFMKKAVKEQKTLTIPGCSEKRKT